MAIDPAMLDQVLGMPEDRDVRSSPIVTAIILADPTNAADLAGFLDEGASLRARNARRILCLFGAAAVPALLSAAVSAEPYARQQALEILPALFAGEDLRVVRDVLAQAYQSLSVLLRDEQPIQHRSELPVERDFQGRICDLAYVVLSLQLSPTKELSEFRAADNDQRTEMISVLLSRQLPRPVA